MIARRDRRGDAREKFTGMRSERGYVALEFSVAMGLLVLPLALVLLQVPTYLERHNRIESIASIVAQECADRASTSAHAQELARATTRDELQLSSITKELTVRSARCE